MKNEKKGIETRIPGMIAGKDLERHLELHQMLLKFSELFAYEEESDRAIAIVGAAFLDSVLEHILFSFLVDDEKEVQEILKPERPLGTYGARTRMLYCVGLISKTVRNDLRIVGKIRNRFAHDLNVSFEDDPIRSWCLELQWHRRAVFSEPPSGATVRDHFQVGVNSLASHLHGVVSAARSEARKRLVFEWEKT